MDEQEKQEPKMIELDEMNIFLRIPRNTIFLDVNAKIMNDSMTIQEVHRDMPISEIIEARNNFLEYVEGGDDYDARYALTENGKEFMREMSEKYDD